MAKQKKTLVVVDMQPYYLNDTHDKLIVIRGVKQLVKLAIVRGWSIIFVEYDGCGKTHPGLVSICTRAGYAKNVFFVQKYHQDGSKEIETLTWRQNLPKDFVVCGIYTEQCVFSTLKGLHVRMPEAKLALAWDACAPGGAIGEEGKMQSNVKLEFYGQLQHELQSSKKPEKIVKIIETQELS